MFITSEALRSIILMMGTITQGYKIDFFYVRRISFISAPPSPKSKAYSVIVSRRTRFPILYHIAHMALHLCIYIYYEATWSIDIPCRSFRLKH